MKCKLIYSALTMLCMLSAAVSCDGASGTKGGDNIKPEDVKPGDPIVVVDGKVRFYVDIDGSASRLQTGMSKEAILEKASAVYVNGTKYDLTADDSGSLYADVLENARGTYRASLSLAEAPEWFDGTPTKITVPTTQFWTEGESLPGFPMYGAYSEATGNKLFMSDALGVLNLKINGSGSIVSVKLLCDGTAMSGIFMKDGDKFISSEQANDYVVLNCTNGGVGVPMGSSFNLSLVPGEYKNAKLVVCDSQRRVMRASLDLDVKPGDFITKELTYSSDKDVIWYEGFDLCAWGGNIMGGSGSFGFAPQAGETNNDSGATLGGDEYALETVGYNVGGTGYIQPDVWNDISGKSVGAAHRMSDNYVISRNFSDYKYLFRAREFPGMMAVSYNVGTRGILATPNFSNIDGIRKIKITVRFRPLAGFDDDLLASVTNGGMVESATLDGKPLSLKSCVYKAAASEAIVSKNSVDVPSSMMTAQGWQTLELVVRRATDATYLHLCGNSTANVNGAHGFIVDEIEVTDLGKDIERSSLRVLYWNIQNGMWSDQANDFANFIEWVKRYDPDVCVWCEAVSIYKDNTSTKADDSEKRLPAGWPDVAKKYGHQYYAIGGWRDNYPQVVTSKYPIETLLKITDTETEGKPISHGAAIQQVSVNGRKLNIVTLHTWPQAYGYGVKKADQEASKANNEGDKYREYEIKYILEHTVNASEYSSQTDWLMMGDFNSRNFTDEKFYNLGEGSTAYLCQNAIRDNSDMVDIIGRTYPGFLVSSTAGNARIDYMYASPSMFSKVRNAITVIDTYATPVVDSKYGTGYYNPSDHRPILVDFEF